MESALGSFDLSPIPRLFLLSIRILKILTITAACFFDEYRQQTLLDFCISHEGKISVPTLLLPPPRFVHLCSLGWKMSALYDFATVTQAYRECCTPARGEGEEHDKALDP
jgi:hypothetical protein